MYKEDLKQRIQDYFLNWKTHDPNKWLPKGSIEDLGKQQGYLGETCGRRLRELVEEGVLERRKAGDSLEYRYKF